MVCLGLRGFRGRKRRALGFKALAKLHADVGRFNELVCALDVADRLVAAQRGARHDDERAAVLRALVRTHEELVRALECERLLRENRALLAGVGVGTTGVLVPMEAVRVELAAEEGSSLLRETLSVAASVREEMDRMRR